MKKSEIEELNFLRNEVILIRKANIQLRNEIAIAKKEQTLLQENHGNGVGDENLTKANSWEGKEKWAKELEWANNELIAQNKEIGKRALELKIANIELVFQNKEKAKRAEELILATEKLIYESEEKKKRATELALADAELNIQNKLKLQQEIVNKELEELNDLEKLASQYSRSLIEASLDPLIVINNEGIITDVNEATVNVTGVSREKLFNTNFKDYFTDPCKASKVYQEIYENGFVADFPLTIRDHKLTEVLFNGSPYKDNHGNILGAVIVARDITLLKKNEKDLIEAKVHAEIASEIAENERKKGEKAVRIAEDAVKAKQQFLSNMSHEIRTPMNAIIGFTKVVLKTELTDKQREYLTAIKISGDSMIVLINDILDLAKVDAGKMTFETTPFKLKSSIFAMIHLFETKIQEKNLELKKVFDSNIPEVLLGDPVRLHQIILNLVSNAVKFTNKGSITIEVKLTEDLGDRVLIEFSVTDTGIGITPDKLDKIFENFQQASSGTSRLYGGTGLGLAIVKQLVESQEGSIVVESILNESSTFRFVLPFKKTTASAETDIESLDLDPQIKNIKVLVVEDIALNQLLMKTVLDEFGFEREIAANGRIAIEKLQSNSYDIILMDLQMPEMNGFEATEYIRNTLKSTIPIIALTADVTTVDLAKCREVGMNDYIAKPVDERVLYSKIISLSKKSILPKSVVLDEISDHLPTIKKIRYTDLAYLNHRTKANFSIMMELISLYLEQTPPLLNSMKESMKSHDYKTLYSVAHKMIPSFSIMGIHIDFENMAKKIQDYAYSQLQTDDIQEMINKLDQVCTQVCIELEEEYTTMKNSNN